MFVSTVRWTPCEATTIVDLQRFQFMVAEKGWRLRRWAFTEEQWSRILRDVINSPVEYINHAFTDQILGLPYTVDSDFGHAVLEEGVTQVA